MSMQAYAGGEREGNRWKVRCCLSIDGPLAFTFTTRWVREGVFKFTFELRRLAETVAKTL